MDFSLRPYQKHLANESTGKLKRYGIVLMAVEVRLGKTLISLECCKMLNCKKVLFVTKKKAISSIKKDYKMARHTFDLVVINYESVHKIKETGFDCIIIDEFHSLGAFPRPTLRTKRIKQIFDLNKPAYHIMLSGTPSPESYSQLYHPFWVNQNFTPFKESNFYKWAAYFVDVKKKYVAHGNQVNDYSHGIKSRIMPIIEKYMVSYTQEQAGFASKVNEVVHEVRMNDQTYHLASKLKKTLVLENHKGDVILADTPVKLMQKLHQIYSGTVICENGNAIMLDTSKVDYINENFEGKLAIFYKYKAELDMLKNNIENLTTDLDEFNSTDKSIALQIVSGREGISLKNADSLIMYNIDFSNVSYIQSKDRMTTIDRGSNTVHWLFSKNGIEKEIYRVITQEKAKFNTYYFKKWTTPLIGV